MIDTIIKKGKAVGPVEPDDEGVMDEVQNSLQSYLSVSSISDSNFYFTPDSFGITVEVSHAIGDYAMIETRYSDLKSSINSDNIAWKDFK